MLDTINHIVKLTTKQCREYVSSLNTEDKDNLYNEVLETHSSLEIELEKGYSLDATSRNSYSLHSYNPNRKKYEAKKALYERLDNLYTHSKYVFVSN